jgi:hypothetical protein
MEAVLVTANCGIAHISGSKEGLKRFVFPVENGPTLLIIRIEAA